MKPAGERAEADTEVHHHALHRERRMAPVGWREHGEQRRLRGPEEAGPDTRDGGGEEALPGVVDEREPARSRPRR